MNSHLYVPVAYKLRPLISKELQNNFGKNEPQSIKFELIGRFDSSPFEQQP